VVCELSQGTLIVLSRIGGPAAGTQAHPGVVARASSTEVANRSDVEKYVNPAQASTVADARVNALAPGIADSRITSNVKAWARGAAGEIQPRRTWTGALNIGSWIRLDPLQITHYEGGLLYYKGQVVTQSGGVAGLVANGTWTYQATLTSTDYSLIPRWDTAPLVLPIAWDGPWGASYNDWFNMLLSIQSNGVYSFYVHAYPNTGSGISGGVTIGVFGGMTTAATAY